MELVYLDGNLEVLETDGSGRWKCRDSGVRSDIYNGELFDGNFTASGVFDAVKLDHPKDILVATEAEPVRKREVFRPVKVWKNAKGEQLVDFGQNLAGWVKVKVKGKKGDTLRLYHAELLDAAGNFYTGNLRAAKAMDSYVLDGNRRELEPHFTYHGFRYVKVEGMDVADVEMEAVALYSAMAETGSFACSDAMLNQLHSNILWGLKGNFLEIPTDCPQRSERLGWTGDAQVFARTATYLMDTRRFYAKWLRDVAADQGPNGSVPTYVPRLSPGEPNVRSAMGWGDAAVIMPWEHFRSYGDTSILREQYPSIRKWIGFLESQKTADDRLGLRGYGDWYAMGDSTSLPYINQCFFIHSVKLAGRIADVLGKREDVTYYRGLGGKLQLAFDRYYSGLDTKATSTQTALLLALQFDLLPEERRQSVADRLAGIIKANGDRLATGFLGTPYLLPVLSRFGHTALAYRLLLQRECPSWLYPITRGATTVWERWDAIRPDGSIQETSFNHYSYGAVGEWLYENILGIKPLEPGFRSFEVRPELGGGLSWAKGSYVSAFGKIVSDWKLEKGGMFVLKVEVPVGTAARVWLPGDASAKVLESGKYTFRKKLD